MIPAQNAKYLLTLAPAAISKDTEESPTEIDTLGWEYAEIAVLVGATDIEVDTLAVTESDTAGSGHANVTGLVYGTSTNIAGSTSSKPAAGDDNTVFKFEVDLKGRKRYLNVAMTTGDGTSGTYRAIVTRLSRAHEAPITATAAGCADILRV